MCLRKGGCANVHRFTHRSSVQMASSAPTLLLRQPPCFEPDCRCQGSYFVKGGVSHCTPRSHSPGLDSHLPNCDAEHRHDFNERWYWHWVVPLPTFPLPRLGVIPQVGSPCPLCGPSQTKPLVKQGGSPSPPVGRSERTGPGRSGIVCSYWKAGRSCAQPPFPDSSRSEDRLCLNLTL